MRGQERNAVASTVFNPFGKLTVLRADPSKQPPPTEVTPAGISIDANAEQPPNTPDPSWVILVGRWTDDKLVHDINATESIVLHVSGITIDFNAEQSENSDMPMYTKLLPRVIRFRLTHPEKSQPDSTFIDSGSTTLSSCSAPEKVELGTTTPAITISARAITDRPSILDGTTKFRLNVSYPTIFADWVPSSFHLRMEPSSVSTVL